MQEYRSTDNNRRMLLTAAGILLLLLAGAVVWLLTQGGPGHYRPSRPVTISNPALDVRFTYDASVFKPAKYDGNAEFPLRLDASGFSFYGKRIRGLAKLLVREPGPMLYDLVGTIHQSAFEYYKLEEDGKPFYEDATLGGRLGLHQVLKYHKTPESPGWPLYFPESMAQLNSANIEGWAIFSDNDLFYFYAVSAEPLTPHQRGACVAVINSMRYDAVLGSSSPAAPEKPAAQSSGGAPGSVAPKTAGGSDTGGGTPPSGQSGGGQPAPQQPAPQQPGPK